MVGKTGFEPATPWSQTKCSTKLSHFPLYGALEGIRTPDLLVRSQTLYPAELRAHCHVIYLKWWLQRELNQRHKDFQSSALPTELWSQKKWRFRRESNSRSSAWQADVITATPRNHMVAEDGFEPTTFGLWARRATKLLHSAMINILAEKEGFEPPRRCRPPGFQDQSLQPDLGISPYINNVIKITRIQKMVPKAGLEPAWSMTFAGF